VVAVDNQRGIQELFILAQDYRLELRTKYGIPQVLVKVWKDRVTAENIVRRSLAWLPHVWSTKNLSEEYVEEEELSMFDYFFSEEEYYNSF